ncbi:hypothetical protein CRG98_007662 [Punica granatum]|uniref:Uncharacterized protein n=1 Tax=Punica granatum TaxID=22663 RepID=A0A2I0KU32_PUNGR|nr:hypothetical protein CRG98_007662 [Punica granatum]
MQPPYDTLMRRVLSLQARRTTDRAAWAPLKTSRYAHRDQSPANQCLHGGIPDAIVQQILNRATNGDRRQPPRPRTSRPLYCFPDFASTLLLSGLRVHFTVFWTPRPRTSRPHLLLSTGFGLATLLLFTGFGLAFYRFPRASASHFTAFHGLRPRTLQLSAGFGLSPTTSHPPNPRSSDERSSSDSEKSVKREATLDSPLYLKKPLPRGEQKLQDE